MSGRIAIPPVAEDRTRRSLPLGSVSRLLDTLEKSLIVTDRSGSPLLINARARHFLEAQGFKETEEPNLFSDLLKLDSARIFGEVEKGEHEVSVCIGAAENSAEARIQWMPESDWLVVEIEGRTSKYADADSATQLTVQE
jgi:signal transduction histidine kinase